MADLDNFTALFSLHGSGKIHSGPHIRPEEFKLYMNPSNGRAAINFKSVQPGTTYDVGGTEAGVASSGYDIRIHITVILHNDTGAITGGGSDKNGTIHIGSNHIIMKSSDYGILSWESRGSQTLSRLTFTEKGDSGKSIYDYRYWSLYLWCSSAALAGGAGQCSRYNDIDCTHADWNDTYGFNITESTGAENEWKRTANRKDIWDAPAASNCSLSLANKLGTAETTRINVSNSTSVIQVTATTKQPASITHPITYVGITNSTTGANQNTGYKSSQVIGATTYSFSSLSANTSYNFYGTIGNRSASNNTGTVTFTTRYAGATLSVSNVKAQVTTATFNWSSNYPVKQIAWKVTAASVQTEVGKSGVLTYNEVSGASSETSTYIKGLIPNVQYTVELTPMNCKNYDSTTGGVVQIQFKTVEPAKIVSISNANFGEDLTFEFRRTCDERVRIEFVVRHRGILDVNYFFK